MLEIFISSAVLIGVLALLRRFLRGRISARLQYALWALVLLRLLVPVTTFESKVSVAAVAEPIAQQVQEYSAQRVQTVYIPVDMGENPQTGEPMEAVGRTFVEPLDVARWVWYAGMGATALFFAGVNLRMARRLKKDRVYYGSHRSVPVYIAQNIPSPCLFGLLRPAIYLTEQAAADETQAGQILAHEYSHLCHGDLFWALMRSLCLVIYWFDPFVWWAAVLSRRDGELACDESAIRRLGEEQRFDYGRTLLALATVKLRPGDLLCGATTMTGGKNSLRERIEGIARTKKLSLSLAAVALVIVALAVGCTFSGAESGDPGPEPAVTPAPVATGSPAASGSDSDTVLLGEGYESRTLVIADEEMFATLNSIEGAFEAFTLYSAYLTDCTNESPVPWLTWLRFENEEDKQLSLDNYLPLTHAEILSIEKINEKLFAFTAEINTASDRPAEKILNFLVLDPDEGSYVIRNAADIPKELSENLDDSQLLADSLSSLGTIDPAQTAIQATLLDFIDPAFALVGTDDSYVSDGTAFADMTFEDLLFCTDSWEVDTTPRGDVSRSDTFIALFDGKGSVVIIDAERDEISFHPQSRFYAAYSIPGTSGSFYFDSLLAWASELPEPTEDPLPPYMPFLNLVFTTDAEGRYSRLAEAGPSAAAYEAFYADFEEFCTPGFYYTMMLNREICKYDELAIERGYRLSPRSCTFYGSTETENGYSHEFMMFLDISTDDGQVVSGSIAGTVETNMDSLVTGFVLDHGTVLNADPADDDLGTEMQTGTESREFTRITIPAGCSMGQIFQVLEDNGICDKEALYEAAANYNFSYDWLEGLPLGNATRLEGYLFPDTYDFYPGESAANVIDRFLNRFHSILTPDMQKQADKLNISLHEAVIIASLIEKEAGAGDDRSLFSSVIHNRLNDGQKLQLDSTLNYIKGTSTFDLTYEDMAIDSPYNTYLYEGLPAGPICCPSEASLEAALNPSSTNYRYWYVSEGVAHFFRSGAEFSEFASAHSNG